MEVTINGQQRQFAKGTSILAACRQLGIDVPTLCHDDRLKPSGACRLCVVEVKGWNRHATACNTALLAGMEIQTHSPPIEEVRRTLLEMLAHDYPAEAVEGWPEKDFHHWLKHYRVAVAADVRRLTTQIGNPKSGFLDVFGGRHPPLQSKGNPSPLSSPLHEGERTDLAPVAPRLFPSPPTGRGSG